MERSGVAVRSPGDPLERFLQEHLGVGFSHGLRPDRGRRFLDEIEGSGSGRV